MGGDLTTGESINEAALSIHFSRIGLEFSFYRGERVLNIETDQASDCEELDHIDRAFSAFDLGDERLRPPDLLGERLLR